MSERLPPRSPEKPFIGKKVYFSGPISVGTGEDLLFNHELVQYMKENGADVLSEHVGGRNIDETSEFFFNKFGQDVRTIPNPWFLVREVDIRCVDKATHMVAIVNKPSLGIGVEIQRALDKPKMGLNTTPILCLIKADLLGSLSFMVKGVTREESPDFSIETYQGTESAKRIIQNFLINS